MADSPLIQRLRRRARDAGELATRELFSRSGERGAETLGVAVRGLQTGRQVLDERAARMLESLGLATQQDIERLSRRIGRVRKRLLRMVSELDRP